MLSASETTRRLIAATFLLPADKVLLTLPEMPRDRHDDRYIYEIASCRILRLPLLVETPAKR